MASLISITLLPYLVIFLLIPLVMLITGKVLGVLSDKLKYSRLLLITFVGSLLGGFVRELHPYALIGVFFVVVLWMIKKQLDASWGKALAMTLSGLIIGGALAYGVSYFNFTTFLSKTIKTASSPDSISEMMAGDKVEITNAPKPEVTMSECLSIGKEKVASYPEKKLNSIKFSTEYMGTNDFPATGDGYSDNCMILFHVNETDILYVHAVNNKIKSFTNAVGTSSDKYSDVNDLNILDSLKVLEKLKTDTEFINNLNEFLKTHPELTEKEAIRIAGVKFDSVEFNKYVWHVFIGEPKVISSEIKTEYILDAMSGDILKREKRKGFSEKWEYVEGEWVNIKDIKTIQEKTDTEVKEDDTEVKPSRPKLPSQ